MFSTVLSTRGGDGYVVVVLRGELDLADAAVVAAELAAVAAREPGMIVDLAGLGFIDSSGVAALARGRRQARLAGGDLVEAAAAAGRFKDRARPAPRRPRMARWPRTITWSRTRGLRTCTVAARTPARPGRLQPPPTPQQRFLRSERPHGCH
jgi:anti-anti-sigma factor